MYVRVYVRAHVRVRVLVRVRVVVGVGVRVGVRVGVSVCVCVYMHEIKFNVPASLTLKLLTDFHISCSLELECAATTAMRHARFSMGIKVLHDIKTTAMLL